MNDQILGETISWLIGKTEENKLGYLNLILFVILAIQVSSIHTEQVRRSSSIHAVEMAINDSLSIKP